MTPRIAGRDDEELLMALANTGHEDADELADATAFAAWWASVQGPAAGAPSAAGLAALRGLRRVVVEAALRNNGGPVPGAVPAPVADLALRPRLVDGRVTLVPQRGGDLATEVAAAGLAALLRAAARPTWPRLKACHGADCGWVFVDGSRNGSRRWCDMATCGNRAKSTAFRARHRHAPRTDPQEAGDDVQPVDIPAIADHHR